MKNKFAAISALLALQLALASCLSTGTAAKTMDVPESFQEVLDKIAAYENAGEYLYMFKAANWADIECVVKIYDESHMAISWEQSKTPFLYYCKLNGEYFERDSQLGVFGTAACLNTGLVGQLLFRTRILGGYKFKGQYDQMMHDKKYANGYVSWNVVPASETRGGQRFLDWFDKRDKTLSSGTNGKGSKRDIAQTLYIAESELAGWRAAFAQTQSAEGESK